MRLRLAGVRERLSQQERLSRARGREGKTGWGKSETGWVRERLTGARERLAGTVSDRFSL